MIYFTADTNADFWPLIRCRDNVLNAGVDLNGYHSVTFDELVENNRTVVTQPMGFLRRISRLFLCQNGGDTS